MKETMPDRIDKLLKDAGKTAAQASIEAGMGKDFIRDIKRRGIQPGSKSLAQLAQALKTSSDYLLYGKEGLTPLPVQGLPVVGVIEAGQFRDITLSDQDEEYQTVNVVRDGRYPHARQYALRVSGDSMNELFSDGSYVICADFGETGLALKDGMILHIERTIANTHLVETTLKQLSIKGAKRFLVPRSTNARHKTVELAEPDDMTDIAVRGLVVGSYSPVLF